MKNTINDVTPTCTLRDVAQPGYTQSKTSKISTKLSKNSTPGVEKLRVFLLGRSRQTGVLP